MPDENPEAGPPAEGVPPTGAQPPLAESPPPPPPPSYPVPPPAYPVPPGYGSAQAPGTPGHLPGYPPGPGSPPPSGYGPAYPPAYGPGYPPGGYAPIPGSYPQGAATPADSKSLAALILGVFALSWCWIPFLNLASIALAIAGLVLAIIAIRRARGVAPSPGMAKAGLIVCGLALIIAVTIDVAVMVLIATDDTQYYDETYDGEYLDDPYAF